MPAPGMGGGQGMGMGGGGGGGSYSNFKTVKCKFYDQGKDCFFLKFQSNFILTFFLIR